MNKDLIWAAGFMDGEGTITIKRSVRRDMVNGIYYQPYVSCGQTVKGKEAIYILQRLFGGSVSISRQKKMEIDTITWAVASRKALQCVKQIIPFLVLKDKQANLILEFYKTGYGNRLAKEGIFFEMRKLNVKGKLRLQRLNEKTPNGDVIV